MSTKYATCPVCGAPRLHLELWPEHNMLQCTCYHSDCKLYRATTTPDVYTNPDELAFYGLTPDDVDPAAVEMLTTNRHRIQQYLFNSAG